MNDMSLSFSIQTVLMLIIFTAIAFLFLIIGRRMGYHQGKMDERRDWEKNKVKNRIKASRAVLGGQFSEQIAPYLPGFPFNPSDCRFMGKPIDFIVFKGMDQKEIEEVVFVEVKSGKTRALSPQEKRLKETVEAGRVSWIQYNVDWED